MKKILSIFFTGWFFLSLIFLSPVQAENSSQAQDKGPLTKITFIHYKKNFAKPVPDAAKGSSKGTCYSYIATGAKWKTTEGYIVNPTGSNLDASFVTQAIDNGVAQWEMYGGSNIFGTSSSDLTAVTGFDNKNVVNFGSYSDNNAIAVTTVWGYFGGDPSTREIVEWDMLFNNYYTYGDASTNGSVMDLQNIATHELGHSAGMGDLYSSSCSIQTMFGYSGYGEIIKRDLNNGDIQGIKKLYLH